MSKTTQLEQEITTEFNRIAGVEVVDIYNIPTAVAHVMEMIEREKKALLDELESDPLFKSCTGCSCDGYEVIKAKQQELLKK